MKHTDEYNSTVLSRELENEDSIIYSYYYYYDFYHYHVSSRVLVTLPTYCSWRGGILSCYLPLIKPGKVYRLT